MAHSHQNTLLSRLGFSDPDRSDPKHTLACEYLCKPDVAVKVLTALGIDDTKENISAKTETPVTKGRYSEDQQLVGFIDVLLGLRSNKHHKNVTIEVKVKRCDPADIVKQLKLYYLYHRCSRMVVATCYPVSQSTKDMFAREEIHHIFLGAGFEAYCAERRAEQPVSEEGL